MYQTAGVKERSQHHFDVAAHLAGLLWSWWWGMLLLWRLGFGFRVVPVHPGLVASYYGVEEVGVIVCGVQHVLWNFNTKLLLLRCQQLRQEFRRHSLHGQIFGPMECADKELKPTASAISRIVKWCSRITTAFTLAMTLSFRHVDGRPELGSLSTDVRPSLNRLYHSLICVMR